MANNFLSPSAVCRRDVIFKVNIVLIVFLNFILMISFSLKYWNHSYDLIFMVSIIIGFNIYIGLAGGLCRHFIQANPSRDQNHSTSSLTLVLSMY